MPRLLLVPTLALLALPVAACSENANEPTTAASTLAASPINAGSAVAFGTEIEGLFAEEIYGALGVAIGQLVAHRQDGRTAEAAQAEQEIRDQLNELAGKFTAVAAKADDPEVKAKLETSAARLTQSTDLKVLEDVQTMEDLAIPFGATVGGWLEPVVSIC